MRIFLYEWATGGGLVEEPTSLPASLLREGGAMVRALAADLARIDGCQVHALRDVRAVDLCVPGCNLWDVDSRHAHSELFAEQASKAVWTILIAPEFDRILERAAELTAISGGNLASPGTVFIRLTADKQRTAETLAAAGLPTARAVTLEPDEPLPTDFEFPAVLKPVDGAGSQDTQLIAGPHDTPAPYAWPRRLERFCPGMAASVACLCGGGMLVSLPACRQLISDDTHLRYLGGQLPLLDGVAERASHLAEAALRALPGTHGYVGVDLILGSNPHGDDDCILEVNPRLTTSYVGLRAAAEQNLAGAMLHFARGDQVELSFNSRPIEFDVDGNVAFIG